MKLHVTTDLKLFKTGMAKMIMKIAPASYKGMVKAMEEHKRDCLEIVPKVPYETGHLKEAHRIEVKPLGRFIEGAVIADTPYAASIHEGISRWGTPYKYKTSGTGAKWIQSKMLRYRFKYEEIVKREIRKVLK